MPFRGLSMYFCNVKTIKLRDMLTWKDVIKFATNGNPKPDRRVDKTEVE